MKPHIYHSKLCDATAFWNTRSLSLKDKAPAAKDDCFDPFLFQPSVGEDIALTDCPTRNVCLYASSSQNFAEKTPGTFMNAYCQLYIVRQMQMETSWSPWGYTIQTTLAEKAIVLQGSQEWPYLNPLLLAFFASQRRSALAAKSLVLTAIDLYQQGFAWKDIQFELKIAGPTSVGSYTWTA